MKTITTEQSEQLKTVYAELLQQYASYLGYDLTLELLHSVPDEPNQLKYSKEKRFSKDFWIVLPCGNSIRTYRYNRFPNCIGIGNPLDNYKPIDQLPKNIKVLTLQQYEEFKQYFLDLILGRENLSEIIRILEDGKRIKDMYNLFSIKSISW